MSSIIAGVMKMAFDTDNVSAAASALLAADPLARNRAPGQTL